jgi:dTDP-4-dehydrorhamnose 3,5-epimerase-like enzyme
VSEYERIGREYRSHASTQSYEGCRHIDGVQLIELSLFSDEGGDFCELVRFRPDGTLAALPDYLPAQMSYSTMEPGTLKAWHLMGAYHPPVR